MRIAILADIHGNLVALDAVLKDIESQGAPDVYWLLGDYAAIGPDPAGVIDRLLTLSDARFIRGNTDVHVAHALENWPVEPEMFSDERRLSQHLEMARSFAWTTGALASAGHLPWLASLPLDFREVLADGTRILAVHASPGTETGSGIHPGLEDNQVEELLGDADAGLLLVGHVHTPYVREVQGTKIVNPGSVSNPVPPDVRACYAILNAGTGGYSLELRRVAYDGQAVIEQAIERQHPSHAYIARYMRGQVRPSWLTQ